MGIPGFICVCSHLAVQMNVIPFRMVSSEIFFDLFDEARTDWNIPRGNDLSVGSRNHRSTRFSQDEEVRLSDGVFLVKR